MFLVKFWKRSLLDVPINTNMFPVLEFCCGHHISLPTLYTKYSVYMFWQYHHSLRTEEDIKYIEINFQTRVFLPVRVKPFFASLDNLHLYMFYFGDYSHILVLYFAFVIAIIRNADSLQLVKLFLNQMGRVWAWVGEDFCNCILS